MKVNGHKIMLMMSAMGFAFAASCSKPSSDDDVLPPHSKPEEPVVVEPGVSKDEGIIRLVSYNVGVFSKYLTNSTEMIAKMMLELDADALGINEVDSCTTRTSRIYQAKALAEKMGGWKYHFASAMPYKSGGYGNGVLVRPDFYVEGTAQIAIPKGAGSESRSCAIIKTDKFVYMVAHLDHTSDACRLEGARLITEWAKKNYGTSDKPVFLCGDMNCEPKDAPIVKFQEDWTLLSVTKNTFPSRTPAKCIDFIFALKNKAAYELVGSDVPVKFDNGVVTDASDHLPIYADVKLK